uniref:Secreted protein n=1 Tax=Schistocephalus solidus TaxID=70667 RepID=A0A0V0J2R1_SCHSO
MDVFIFCLFTYLWTFEFHILQLTAFDVVGIPDHLVSLVCVELVLDYCIQYLCLVDVSSYLHKTPPANGVKLCFLEGKSVLLTVLQCKHFILLIFLEYCKEVAT